MVWDLYRVPRCCLKRDAAMKADENRKIKKIRRGLTLIEIIMVVVIIGIASFLAIPMLSGAADMQARSAANQIAADLDYAKSMAMTHQQNYTLVFDKVNDSYQIQDASGTVIENPLRPGTDYVVSFSNNRNLNQVDITNTNFDSDVSDAITFDYLGSPYSGTNNSSALNSGQITVQAGEFTLTVDVEPVTGYVTISGI